MSIDKKSMNNEEEKEKNQIKFLNHLPLILKFFARLVDYCLRHIIGNSIVLYNFCAD